MPELLVEFLSEEIPARMQAGAARDLARMAQERLAAVDLIHGTLRTFAGPRRLVLVVADLPIAQADRREERKGPKVTAPPAALAGFLRTTKLSMNDLVVRDGAYFAETATVGRATSVLVAEMVEAIASAFPWPKSMRSGTSAFRWVRPLKGLLCLFAGEVVPLVLDGLVAGRDTRGHRFMGTRGAAFPVEDFADYVQKLEAEFVVVDAAVRRERIERRARALAGAAGLQLVDDSGLLDEVCGLVEWPTPVLGAMERSFLDLPPEVIRTSMRTHQRYFALTGPAGSGLAPRFVVVANVEATDGGAGLAAGNARVLTARLEDARFFWNEDRRLGAFGRWAAKLEGVTFHAKLGTLTERVGRIESLADEICSRLGLHEARPLVRAAARLCKLDLASLMVGEFPELQGVMGGYYVRASGPDLSALLLQFAPELGRVDGSAPPPAGDPIERIADAVRDHYKPLGPSDETPTELVTVVLALADKLDTLGGFFRIGEKPTGSRDPYALRRAALGVIRLLRENGVRLALRAMFPAGQADELTAFFVDRLRVLLRDEGLRHDVIDAVLAAPDDDLVRVVAKVEALQALLRTEDGVNLLAGYRRAGNILRAEARKHPEEDIGGSPDAALFVHRAERELATGLQLALSQLDVALQHENFDTAMTNLARLRGPVDAFFGRCSSTTPTRASG